MSDLVTEAATAAADLVGRAGARSLEVGYLHDTPRSEDADWWASANYRGARIMVEHHTGPTAALEALAARLLTGAMCAHCGGAVTLDGTSAVFYRDAARPGGVVFTEEDAKSRPLCHWRRTGRRWVEGCKP